MTKTFLKKPKRQATNQTSIINAHTSFAVVLGMMTSKRASKSLTRKDAMKDDPRQDESTSDTDTQSQGPLHSTPFPFRDTHLLFASPETVACATTNGCVPCAYKVGLFDVALDKEFCRAVPNQRPEQCPRLLPNHPKSTLPKILPLGYRPGMSVLTVGDGDFSFSLAIARLLHSFRSKNSNASLLVATSYETEETLRQVYPNYEETKQELLSFGVKMRFQVDATRIQDTLHHDDDNNNDNISSSSFIQWDRICWNFPCTAIAKGQDGQNDEMERNKDLVRKFVANATPMLIHSGGEIHICHKTKPPFNQWKLETVALESQTGPGSAANIMKYVGRVVLDRALLPPYTPRKALDRKSFPCHDACFYIFVKSSNNNNNTRHHAGSSDHDTKVTSSLLQLNQHKNHTTAIPVTRELIQSIRNTFLSQATTPGTTTKRSHKRQKVG